MKIEFREEYVSQIPALQLLLNLGYEYLTPHEALRLRGNRKSNVILTDILREWLQEHNHIEYRGQVYQFSEAVPGN
jgi:type I restriction enzyme R subunit